AHGCERGSASECACRGVRGAKPLGSKRKSGDELNLARGIRRQRLSERHVIHEAVRELQVLSIQRIENLEAEIDDAASAGAQAAADHRVERSIAGPDEAVASGVAERVLRREDRKSTRLNSSHRTISYAVFCL